MIALLACAPSPWTREAALNPILSRLDADHDGRVVQTEYEPFAWRAPFFVDVDQDADGTLSVGELDRLLFIQDPNTFDGSLSRTPPDLSLGPGVSGTMDTRQRLVWELLAVLRDEAVFARPDALVPDVDRIEAAARTGDISNYEVRSVLGDLERAWNVSAGLTFPKTLAPGGSGPSQPRPGDQPAMGEGPGNKPPLGDDPGNKPPLGDGPGNKPPLGGGPGNKPPLGGGKKPPLGPDGRPG